VVRHWTDDDTPREKFKLRPKHALLLVDALVLAVIFMAAGQIYVSKRGTKMIAAKEQERLAAQQANAVLLTQADSVAAASQATLAEMKTEHAQSIDELQGLKAQLEADVPRTRQLEQGLYSLSDVVLDLRERSVAASKDLKSRERNVHERKTEVDSLKVKSEKSELELQSTRSEYEQTTQSLGQAKEIEVYDPKGTFPANTGVAVRRDMSNAQDLTNLELQHLFYNSDATGLGMSMAFGLGASEEAASNKELGVLLTKPLIHRRLGLDLGAGFTQLTSEGGSDDNGGYASAALRLSPFYKERVHFGLGARAAHGDFVPFLGFAIGRR
jgi:hypothetical protein